MKILLLKHSVLAACVALIFFACSKKNTCDEPIEHPVDLSWISWEDSLHQLHTPSDFSAFFHRHEALAELVFHRSSYPTDSIFFNTLFKRFSHPAMDTVYQQVKKKFSDNALQQQFQRAFSKIKSLYPSYRIPAIQTIYSGMETDMVVSDSLIIVGLDFYLGVGAKYRPDVYAYMLPRYEKSFIVPSIVLLIGMDGRINKNNPQDKTILADMLAYGKAYYFGKLLLPCVADSTWMGYSGKEIEEAEENQAAIWSRLTADEVFFQDNQRIRQRYLSERPKTYEVGNACPGRIGAWVGWKIVQAYMDASKKSLTELMQTTDAKKIFKESHYKPTTH